MQRLQLLVLAAVCLLPYSVPNSHAAVGLGTHDILPRVVPSRGFGDCSLALSEGAGIDLARRLSPTHTHTQAHAHALNQCACTLQLICMMPVFRTTARFRVGADGVMRYSRIATAPFTRMQCSGTKDDRDQPFNTMYSRQVPPYIPFACGLAAHPANKHSFFHPVANHSFERSHPLSPSHVQAVNVNVREERHRHGAQFDDRCNPSVRFGASGDGYLSQEN
jgi:hypothetical protein